MKYWDSSALVALLIEHDRTPALRRVAQGDAAITTWWATQVECMSAVTRRARAGHLTPADLSAVTGRLRAASAMWTEITPTDDVREQALRILRVHPLRAADSLQLAAAIVAAEYQPRSLDFITLDAKLGDAADAEGFRVIV